jgi:antibiotic biosynthesis monooxygenase (ABM) superfamily enzyme
VNEDLDSPVTTVIRHRPLADAVGRYEDWLKEITLAAQQFAGHRGVNVIRPHGAGDVYTIVLHFDTVEHLRKWLDSDVRRQLVRKIRPFLRSEESMCQARRNARVEEVPLFRTKTLGHEADNFAQPTMRRLIVEPARPNHRRLNGG